MTNNSNSPENHIEELIVNTLNKALFSSKQSFTQYEWMTLKDGAKYAGVAYNTFIKFREKGLKVSEVDGVKRVSRNEIDKFLENHSF